MKRNAMFKVFEEHIGEDSSVVEIMRVVQAIGRRYEERGYEFDNMRYHADSVDVERYTMREQQCMMILEKVNDLLNEIKIHKDLFNDM